MADNRLVYRERYYRHLTSVPTVPDVEKPELLVNLERAFVVEGNGRTVISAPVRELATNAGFLYLHGRFVEADRPNRNNAMWTTQDLEMGQSTVAGGPLNWLHQDTTIIGALLDGHLVAGREAAAAGVNNHIASTAAVWRFLHPEKANEIEKAAADKQLWYSMECVSNRVACVAGAGNGCGEEFSYRDFLDKKTCAHLTERASVRRFVDPVFLGGAVIVPPVQPGWAQADVDVVRQAASVTEQQGLAEGNMTRPEAEWMVQRVLEYANR